MLELLGELTAFAEGEAATGGGTAAGPASPAGGIVGMIVSLLPLILIFVVMYMIMIRPQRKKEKALREKISKMKVGDKVVSIGGIMGKVSKIKDDFVILETGNIGTQDQKSFIKMEKSSIKDIFVKESD